MQKYFGNSWGFWISIYEIVLNNILGIVGVSGCYFRAWWFLEFGSDICEFWDCVWYSWFWDWILAWTIICFL